MAEPTARVLEYPISQYTNLTFYADGEVNSGDVVGAGTNDGEVSPTGDDETALGVAYPKQTHDRGTQEQYEDGESVAIVVDGVVNLEASGEVEAGDSLVPAEDGTVVAYDDEGGDLADQIIARAHESGASGDRVEARLI